MLTEFNFHAPSFVVAGRNSVHQTGELLNQWGAGKNIMVVCGNKTYSLGLLNSLLDSIRSGGFTPCVFHGSLPDAPVETVRSGVAYAKEHDVSAIVAFGGGSAMDTAKAIACILDVEGDIVAYCKGLIKPTRRSKLLFAIPTTCGTGSESTDIGVVLDQEENYKYIFSNPFAGPDVAILDPVLLTALSPAMIAATAMDAFSHSAEAYTCKAANVMMEPLALSSMEMIVKHLPAAMKAPGDLDELEQLLIASCMAGQAFTQVGLHLGHAIAHGVGVYGHVHHGTACALVLPYALSSVSEAIPDRIAKIGEILGAKIPAQATPREIGLIVSDALQLFNRSIGIKRLSDYGVTEEQLDSMAEYAVHEGGTQGNSFRPSPKAEVVDYLRSIL